MTRNHLTAIILAFSLLTIYSCKDDSETLLDEELTDLLYETSDGQGPTFFQLPASNDFTNIPQDANNPLTNEKVELGKLLFHETAIATDAKLPSSKFTYSCASCHNAKAGFQACLPQGIGEGGLGFGLRGESRVLNPAYADDELDVQPIRSPAALNTAFQEVMLWNGQFGAKGVNEGTEAQWTTGTPKATNNLGFEGVETQAIAALTVHRLKISEEIVDTTGYKAFFDAAFAESAANERYSRENAGLAIAAYERTILANKAPFQKWLNGESDAMSDSEKKGAILFFGKAQCVSCHTGPALNSMEFYGLGMHDLDAVIPNAIGAVDAARGRGGFTGIPFDDFKFKVPQLYNLTDSPFFGHGANFLSVKEVINYKNEAVPQNQNVPDTHLAEEFVPLGLTAQEINDLTAFLEISLNDGDLNRYVPDELPSGLCFPNNDPQSVIDLGCE